MDSSDSNISNSFRRKHFARLHEKIRNKYEQMQKRLEKSKSVDTLATIKDDEDYKDLTRNSSHFDIRNTEETMIDGVTSAIQYSRHSMIIEEIPKNDANLQYLEAEQANVSDFETLTPKSETQSLVNTFFGNEFSGSIESLNEVVRDNDEYQIPQTPTQTIRNRIGSRISIARERRRQLEREKNAMKDKKKESREKVEKFILSNTSKQDPKVFKRTKVATVTVALIEATGLEADSLEEKQRTLHCRFRLGTEKYKSKLIKSNTSEVKWLEMFNFNLYEDNTLEISLWDKDNCIGRSLINLIELERERTHKMKIKLDSEGGNVQIFILLTISGVSLTNAIKDLDYFEEIQGQYSTVRKKYAWYRITDGSSDVGWVSVIVYGAKGLSANDCCCVLEFDNERLQTHTEFKTNDPCWMKIFHFAVSDITSILHITVHDEKKSEGIGKLSIPLLSINSGQKKWYALKDPTLKERAKGNNPRILLEMKLTWNLVKASLRVINPKEPYYLEIEDKLDRHIFGKNLARARIVVNWILNAFRVVKTCFEWESRKMNMVALAAWLLFCWFFKMWMLPLLLLIPFIWYRPPEYFILNWKQTFTKQPSDEVQVKKEEKNTSLRQKIQSFQETLQIVQNFIGNFADFGESVKNLFNFSVPFLSVLAIFFVVIIASVMYMIPTKYIFMIWGIHKFTRKTLRPNRIPNNEILDLLSRVPNDEVLINCEELELEEIPDEDVIK